MRNLGYHLKLITATDIGDTCNIARKILCFSKRKTLIWTGLPHNIVQGHAFVNNMTEKGNFWTI
jgi:hypothetical protein